MANTRLAQFVAADGLLKGTIGSISIGKLRDLFRGTSSVFAQSRPETLESLGERWKKSLMSQLCVSGEPFNCIFFQVRQVLKYLPNFFLLGNRYLLFIISYGFLSYTI